MKKISVLKNLAIGSGAALAAITPLVLTVGCANTKGVETNYISWKTIISDKNLDNMNSGHYSNDDIILGSKNFFDGNYILFVGSNTYDTTCFFFSGSTTNRNLNLWATDSFKTSILYNDVFLVDQSKDYDDFGFVTFIDNSNNQVVDKSGHKLIVTKDATKGYWATWPIRPFDKWDDGIITQTRQFMKDEFNYDWNDDDDNPEVKAGDYIRQDDQAKTFREFATRGLALFPTNDDRKQSFDTADGNSTSLMIMFQDGALKEIVTIPTSPCLESKKDEKDTTTVTGAINKYFLNEEEEED